MTNFHFFASTFTRAGSTVCFLEEFIIAYRGFVIMRPIRAGGRNIEWYVKFTTRETLGVDECDYLIKTFENADIGFDHESENN